MENDEEVEYDENKEKGNQDYYADRRDSLTGRADLFVSEENHSKLSKIPGTGHLTSFVRHHRDKYTVKEQRPLQKKKRTFCTLTPNQWLTLLSTFLLPLALAAYGVITAQQDAKEAQSNRDSDIEAADQRRRDDLANAAELRYSNVFDSFVLFMFDLDRQGYLNEDKFPWSHANARFRAAYYELDALRRGWCLQFLKQHGMIGTSLVESVDSRLSETTTRLGEHVIKLTGLSIDSICFRSEAANVSKLDMNGIRFDLLLMSNTSFENVNLDSTTYTGSRVSQVMLQHSTLKEASFNSTTLNNLKFRYSNLNNVTFYDAKLDEISFTKVDLKNANFSGSTLANIDFTSVNLQNASFTDTVVLSSKFIDTSFEGAHFSNVSFSSDINITALNLTVEQVAGIQVITTTPLSCEPFLRPPSGTCSKPTWSENATTLLFLDFGLRWKPHDIFMDRYDNLYVVDKSNRRVIVFQTGINVGSTGVVDIEANDVFADSDGNIFIPTSAPDGLIQKWKLHSIERGVILANVSGQPLGIFVSNKGNIYVTEHISNNRSRILKYPNSTYKQIVIYTRQALPEGLFVDQCENVYWVDEAFHQVMKFNNHSARGEVVAGVPFIPGNSSQHLNGPRDVILDAYGNLYIADRNNHRIQRKSGNTTEMIAGIPGIAGSANTQLKFPQSLAFDSHWNLYVSDSDNERIQKFQFESGDLWC